MGEQLFISPDARILDGWRCAFGERVRAGNPSALPDADGDGLLWVDVEHDGWEDLVRAAGARGRRVVVLSAMPSGEQALRALEVGARGYCHAFATPELLREVALVVRHGGLWVGPELLARVIRAAAPAAQADADAPAAGAVLAALSTREREVAEAVAEGLTNKVVAARLGITERTVKAHLATVFDKLGVRDRLQLALRVSRRHS